MLAASGRKRTLISTFSSSLNVRFREKRPVRFPQCKWHDASRVCEDTNRPGCSWCHPAMHLDSYAEFSNAGRQASLRRMPSLLPWFSDVSALALVLLVVWLLNISLFSSIEVIASALCFIIDNARQIYLWDVLETATWTKKIEVQKNAATSIWRIVLWQCPYSKVLCNFFNFVRSAELRVSTS